MRRFWKFLPPTIKALVVFPMFFLCSIASVLLLALNFGRDWSQLSHLSPVEIIQLLELQMTPRTTSDEVVALMSDYGVADCKKANEAYVMCKTPARPPSILDMLSGQGMTFFAYFGPIIHDMRFKLQTDSNQRIVFVDTYWPGASNWYLRVDSDSDMSPHDDLSLKCEGEFIRSQPICWLRHQ